MGARKPASAAIAPSKSSAFMAEAASGSACPRALSKANSASLKSSPSLLGEVAVASAADGGGGARKSVATLAAPPPSCGASPSPSKRGGFKDIRRPFIPSQQIRPLLGRDKSLQSLHARAASGPDHPHHQAQTPRRSGHAERQPRAAGL